MWDEAEPAVKQFFMNLAHDIKSKHSSAFPDFTWSVKKQVSNGQDINSKAPRKRSKPVKVANVPVLNLEPQLIYHPSFTLDNNMHQQQLFPKSADLFKMNSWAVSTPLDPNMVSGFWDSRWACQDDFLGSINSSSNVVTIGLAEQAMYSSPELIVNTQISHSKPETASAIFAFPENDFRGQALPKIDIALSPAANELDTWSALFKTPTMPSFAY